jgi:hypothetical protein
MNRKIFFLLFPLVMGVLFFGATFGADAFYFSYFTCFQVQNLSASTANISIDYYDQAGSVVTSVADTIAASGSTTYCPIAPASPFNGSVVVSSDQSLAAVTNVLGDMGAASASYVGSSTGATTLNLPLLFDNNVGYNTWINVQNMGGSSASVTIDYSDGTSALDTIPVGASATFDQSVETHSLSVFSGTVTSDQPVAATVIEEDSGTMFAYSGFPAGSTDPVMPLINMNNTGYITGIQIQNIGGSPTDVTVSYTPSTAGTACTETQTISSGESKTFALFVFFSLDPAITSNCVLGETFVGSARVTANSASQDLVAVVNQVNPGTNGEAYGAFDPALATDTVVLPLIMDRNVGWFTGFNVMNVGSGSTTVNCTFTGTGYTASATLAVGEAMTDIQLNQIGVSYVGSATCTAGSGGKIVAVVNELGSGTGDELMVYEGILVP